MYIAGEKLQPSKSISNFLNDDRIKYKTQSNIKY